jgi:hypothetical protein
VLGGWDRGAAAGGAARAAYGAWAGAVDGSAAGTYPVTAWSAPPARRRTGRGAVGASAGRTVGWAAGWRAGSAAGGREAGGAGGREAGGAGGAGRCTTRVAGGAGRCTTRVGGASVPGRPGGQEPVRVVRVPRVSPGPRLDRRRRDRHRPGRPRRRGAPGPVAGRLGAGRAGVGAGGRRVGRSHRPGRGGQRRAAPGEPRDGVPELLRGGPVGGVGTQHRGQEPGPRLGDAVEVDRPAPHPVPDGLQRAAAERGPAGRGERHHRPPAPPVGGRPHVAAVEHLGRQVARRAHHEPGRGEGHVVQRPRDPEVDDDRRAVEHEDVARLEVAVDDPDRVDGGDRLEQPDRELVQQRAGQRALSTDQRVQRLPRHVAHDHVRQLGVEVGVEHLRHPGVAHPQQRPHLPGEPGPGLGVRGDVRTDHLDGDGTVGGVQPEVHDTHAALADDAEQAVAAHGPPRRHVRLTGPTVRRGPLPTVAVARPGALGRAGRSCVGRSVRSSP